jgi:hypothetical protein
MRHGRSSLLSLGSGSTVAPMLDHCRTDGSGRSSALPMRPARCRGLSREPHPVAQPIAGSQGVTAACWLVSCGGRIPRPRSERLTWLPGRARGGVLAARRTPAGTMNGCGFLGPYRGPLVMPSEPSGARHADDTGRGLRPDPYTEPTPGLQRADGLHHAWGGTCDSRAGVGSTAKAGSSAAL